jgi:hypothetical protein
VCEVVATMSRGTRTMNATGVMSLMKLKFSFWYRVALIAFGVVT